MCEAHDGRCDTVLYHDVTGDYNRCGAHENSTTQLFSHCKLCRKLNTEKIVCLVVLILSGFTGFTRTGLRLTGLGLVHTI